MLGSWLLLSLGLAASAQVPASTAPVISEIRVHRYDIFDTKLPGENNVVFRVANKIHIVTRESVIRRELLMRPGDPWDPFKALESERNLRANGFFRRVEISSRPAAGNKLDLDVETQDSWTTLIQLSAGTEGGDRFFIYGIEEKNLGGWDKSVSFTHSQIGPAIRNDFNFADPRFLDTRYRLLSLFGTSLHGQSMGVDLTRPFFSAESGHAQGASWSKIVDERILYKDGEELTRFISNSRTVQGAAAVRLSQDRWFVQRPQLGWYSERDLFTGDAATTIPIPTNRELSGPTLGYTAIQPHYVKETYINRMERVEDFNMGNEFYALGGYMGQALGSDRDRLIFNVLDQQGLRFAPGRFILAQIGASGRQVNQQLENALFYGNFNVFWKTFIYLPQTFVAHAEFNSSRGLDGENQIILGGNSGLRGFKNNSFVGNKSVLFNLEDRIFWPGEYFHLFRFGAAIFYDAGSVGRFKSDVGLGLRFSPTRSTGGRVFRVDVAYALNSGPASGRWVLALKGGQAFDIFNSSTKQVKQSPSSRLNETTSNEFRPFAE